MCHPVINQPFFAGIQRRRQLDGAEHHDEQADVLHPRPQLGHRVHRRDLRRQRQGRLREDALRDLHPAG